MHGIPWTQQGLQKGKAKVKVKIFSKLKIHHKFSSTIKTAMKKKNKTTTKTTISSTRRIRYLDLSQEGPTGSPVHSWNFVFWNASVLSTSSTSFYYPSTPL